MRKKIFLSAALLLVIAVLYTFFKSKTEPQQTSEMQTASASRHLNTSKTADTHTSPALPSSVTTDFSDAIDMTKWQYNAQDEVYYQLGITYCKTPADSKYEKLALFVPKNYLKCTPNSSQTYSCTPDNKENVGIYTANTAPFLMPIDSPEYAANPALTDYVNVKKFTDAGFIYLHVGFRGREHAAPHGLVDLKAAIRYLRHNKKIIAGNTDYIIPFGFSGGGGLSILLGTTGNNPMFRPYLRAIGAIDGGSDKVYGVMAWSPITNFDSADAAYEWNMGRTRNNLSESQKQLSDKMARAYADYVNNSGFIDTDKTPLLLNPSPRGIYQQGYYYEYVKAIVENALFEYLNRTNFPHRVSTRETKDFKGEINIAGYYMDKEKYINTLNAKRKWVHYGGYDRTIMFRSLEDFTRSLKPATKNIGAFDSPTKSSPANILFGDGQGNGYHFSSMMLKVLKNTPLAPEYAADLKKQDEFGNSVQQRVNMYTPLYFIMPSYDGYRTSSVAPFWRIRSGAFQTDTSLMTDLNLMFALQQYPQVSKVDFKSVWNAGHTKAEEAETDSDKALIKWVNKIMQEYYKWDVNN